MNLKKNNSIKLILMIGITLITQVFILIRVSVIASKFGVSMELDAFNFANSIGTLVFSFITTGVTTILIPNLGVKEKEKAVNSFITILYALATGILFVGIIFRSSIVKFFSENNNEQFIGIATKVLIIILLAQYIASFIGLSNAVLQYQNKFNRSKIIILITNILIVIMLLMKKNLNVYDYAKIILVTSIFNIFMQFIFMYLSGFKMKIAMDIKDETLKIMLKSFVPIILSTGLYQISLMIDTSIASGLGEGKISTLNYASNVTSMINMLLIMNITSFLYPKIAKNIKKENSQEELSNYIILINAILTLVVIGVFIVGKEGLEILYMRGEFTQSNIELVYLCTIGYIVAVPISAIRDILYKYFYANNDTKTPFKNSFLISILNIIISVILARYIGILGVVLGTTVTSILSCIFISFKFKKQFGYNFNKQIFVYDNIKIMIAAIITLILSIVLRSNIDLGNNFLNICIFGSSIIVIYTALLYCLKSRIFKTTI